MTDKTTILYIEDDPGSQVLVQRTLLHAGYRVVVASRGIEGLDLAAKELPDLILMDINLPDINGLEATARLKASPQLSWIPIIALTANAMHGDREHCIAAGCDGYLAKPVMKNELLTTVAAFLGQSVSEVHAAR